MPQDHYADASIDAVVAAAIFSTGGGPNRTFWPYRKSRILPSSNACEPKSLVRPTASGSYLDLSLLSPCEVRGENATWMIRAVSFAVASKGPDRVTVDDTPARFDSVEGTDISDHWIAIFAIDLK